MENVVVQTDDQSRFSWDSIRSTYNDGILTNRLTQFDDGTLKDVSYNNGIRTFMYQLDNQLGSGSKAWDSIETYYGPNGSLAGRISYFDNGVIREESFDNGVRTMTAQYDNPQYSDGGAKSWESIVTYYDEAGLMAGRETVYDNGIIKQESFLNGVRSKTVQTDNAQDEGQGAKNWEMIETYYDEAGELAARVTFFDNGVVREEEFSAGVRMRTLLTDNPQEPGGTGVKSWSTFQSFYDEAGVIVAREIVYDDGRVRQDTYENGVIATTEIQDDAFGGASQYAWTAINMYYDENGKIAQKFTVYDDGRVRQDEYADGVRVQSVVEDRYLSQNGNFDWDTMYFSYDANGKMDQKTIAFDDGDVVESVYLDGALTARNEFDGDNSEAWLGRVTTYNADGSVANVETFSDYADLPPDFMSGSDANLVYALG